MMLTAVLVALVFVTALNWYIGETLLYPPATFAAAWLFYLTLYAVSGHRFLPITDRSLLFFLAGAVMMTVGGFLTSYAYRLFASFRADPATVPDQPVMGWPLSFLVIILAAAIPLFVRHVMNLVAEGPSGDFWLVVRNQMISSYEAEGANQFHAFDNLITLAAIVAMVACWEEDGSTRTRLRMYASALTAVLYLLGTASRGGAVSLLFSLFAIRWLKQGKPSRVAIVSFISLIAVVVFSMAWVLQKGDINKKDAFVENAGALYDSFLLYTVGPAVAFDQITLDPSGVPPTQSVSRPFLLLANKIGAHFDVPSLHAEYTTVGRIGNQNVYTLYFSYLPDFGFTGALLLLIVVGSATTLVFILARRGNRVAVVLCGFFFASAVLSAFTEYYFLAVNFIARIALITWLLYVWEHARSRPGHSVGVRPAAM